MYPTQLTTIFNTSLESETSPELRRMDMINRARREEVEAMIYGIAPRKQRVTGQSGRMPEPIVLRALNSVRDGIGNALISAGNRIQSA